MIAATVRPVFDKLRDLYRGVAVHATADQEHQAALEVLLLVMFADGQLLLDDIDGRITSRVLRMALVSAAREIVGEDQTDEEGTLLTEIAVRFG